MIRKLLEIDWNAPAMRAFDWSLALVSLGIGLYLESAIWIVGGIAGAALAWWRPMARVQAFTQSAIKRRGRSSP